MAQLNFNAAQVAPDAGKADAIPAGWYTAAIDESEMKATAAGDGAYLNLRLAILDGQYVGRKVFARLNLQNANPTAVTIAYGQLSAICHAVGVIQCGDSQELHGKPMKIKVSLRAASGDYEASNDVKAYKNVNDPSAGGAPAGAPAGVPAGFGAPAAGGMPAGFGGAPAFAPAAQPQQQMQQQQQFAPAAGAPQFAPQQAQQPAQGGWQQPAGQQPWQGQPGAQAPQQGQQFAPAGDPQQMQQQQQAPQFAAPAQQFAAPAQQMQQQPVQQQAAAPAAGMTPPWVNGGQPQ